MPLLGCAKHKLAARLGSAATAGEGTQNYLCAAQAAAVLAGLAITAASGILAWAFMKETHPQPQAERAPLP